ncbi:PREDICTED: pericentrin [Miniopterus natalensis]|uniref:pericentrin n=1 Tax=Miniopterus natalensis TaxID=291302 RepID=UPI0007A70EFF|nr:PREDICTED: pericentrin [Miniopterus natalensis]
MEEDEQEQRRRKVEAGRAKLAHFRQRKTKGDCAHSKKKTAKRKGSTVDAPVQEESPVATKDGGFLGGGDVCKTTLCSDTPDGAAAAQLENPDGARTKDLEQPLQKLDGNGSEQPGVLTKEYEQECKPGIAELMSGHEDRTIREQWAMLGLPAEMQQPVPPLELEALRLSLSNMHTVQLELTQANLQREKETALMELRDMLNGRHAQELALLQNRQLLELELVREQHAREREEAALRCTRETAELKEKLQSEMERNVQIIETLKQDWESERDLCLESLRKELSAKHQSELENLQSQFKKELAEQKAELEKIFQAKNQAELSLQTLQSQHDAAVKKLQEDLQSERCRHAEDLDLRVREKEREKQLELENLQASYEELKAQSQEEVRRLWSQLESTRTDKQELSDLREQLLARASHVEELEHLQRDFEQQQQREKTEHESELEQLRLYFEKKLRDAEKNYQEDLTLLQQRLQEVREDSLLESMEISSSSVVLEETSEKEGRDHPDQLGLHVEQHEEGLCLHTQLEESPQHQVAAQQEVNLAGTQVLTQHVGLSEEPGQELARVCFQGAQDPAVEVETQVATTVLGMETEHKVKLSLQTELQEEINRLKIENRNLHEKLQREIRLKEDLEKVKHNLVEDHREELGKVKEQIQLMNQELKEREAEWKGTSEVLKREAEEKLTLMLLDLREQAELEKQSIINRFELREIEMRQLQDQQAAQIVDLEGSLMEQQGRLRQLELGLAGDESLQCGQGPSSGLAPANQDQDRELATFHLKEDCALQMMLAQNRFLEKRKEITEKFTAEQDALLREAQEKHASELQLLQERHQQHILSLTAELEAKHQANVEELKAVFQREQWALSEARVAELQTKHAAEIHALETRHLSHLDSVESCYLSEIQTLRDEHRQALELLRGDLEEQLQKKDSSHQMILTQELEKLQRKHEEPESAKGGQRTGLSTEHTESLRALATELQGAHQEELAAALLDQRHLLEEGKSVALDKVRAEVLLMEQQHQAALQELGDMHAAEMQRQRAEQQALQERAMQNELEREKKAALHEKKEIHRLECEQAQSLHRKEKESLSLQLQEKNNQILQLKDQILSLNREIEERRSELETLQQRRDRENQEGTNLISMLKSDVDLSHSERIALQDSLRRLLGLFGETLKAAISLKSRISDRVGLCLEDESLPDVRPGGQAPSVAPALDETWPGPDVALPELDRTLTECTEVSSMADISSHICESFFMSPESTLECEQPIRSIYRSLGLAVDGLLEMVLDSSRQLEEARQIHAHFEKEFSCKNEETAQVVRKHQELLERLEEENSAKTRLMLELHKAEGIIEGFKVEKASLQEALGQKEASEQGLVAELESLNQQLQQVTRQQAELKEENSVLCHQKEVATAEAEEREAGVPVTIAHKDSALRREVEAAITERLETRQQCEKDRSALLAQVKLLEAELEEQLLRHQACASQAEELGALRQQMVSLDKHLRSQRQFMDEQAVEREHEREEFQQEIQRLEEQLRRAAQLQPRGPRDSDRAQLDKEVELLQEKLREKSDELTELAMKKELADRQVLIQEKEIKHLEETNADTRRKVIQLQEELEKQRKAMKELQQDKEALQQQQMSNLLLVSTLQSKLDEGKCSVLPVDSCPEGPEIQLEAVQRALIQRESEVLDLKEQLEKIKDDLVSKNEEVLHLNLKLDLQNNHTAISVRGLQEENANLKAFLQNKEKEILCMSEQLEAQLAGMGSGALREVMYRSSEVEELKSVIETLQENQDRLQKDKAEEIEQLHEVIEKLQRELSLGGPAEHELGDSQAEDLQSELERGLCCLQAEGAEAQAVLRADLQAALEAKEALSQLLAEQECQHSQSLEALQQRLRVAEEAAERHLAQLRSSATLREAEIQGLASQIQEFEAALKAKDAEIAQRDLEIEAINKRRSAHSTELEAILLAFTCLRRTLEQQLLRATREPPELQRLRVQCVRLSHQLQALNHQFLRCQKELDKQQTCGAPVLHRVKGSFQGLVARSDEASCDEELEQNVVSRQLTVASPGQDNDPQSPVKDDLQPAKALVTVNHMGLHKQDSVMSVLTVCQRQLESELLLVKNEMHLSAEDHGKASGTMKDKEEEREDRKLYKVDLITQVEQLQEKLNRLVYSMNFQNTETEDFNSQQPLAFSPVLENSLRGSSSNGEETDKLSPVDAFNINKITWDLMDIIGNQDSLIRNEMPNVSIEDKVDLQDGSLCLQGSLPSDSCDLTYTDEAEPLKNALSTMDLSSWSSPEVVRKDSMLEPLPSLPLTPCLDTLSQHSLDTSLRNRTSPLLLQADQSGLLCSLSGSATVKAPCSAESSLATDRAPCADHHVHHTAVEKDVEDFIITSLDFQEKSRSPPLGLEGKSNGSENSDGSGCGEILNHSLGGLKAPIVSPAVPPPASGSFRQPLEAMKEKEVHPKQVKALLQMVYDESHHILALSEYHGYPSALSKGEPSAPIEHFLRGGQGLLEALPALRGHLTPASQQGEKEPSDTCLDWRGEFLQVVQDAFEKERDMLTVQLQPQLCGSDTRAHGGLVERLQKVVQEQGDLQEKSLEHLRQSDRSSLLSEIQALRAQLRLTHLQNQEKLQQLCAALTSAEARGSRQEHQLRRQVELLAYKVEQEKCIVSDLQKTLSEEQEKANNVRKLLVVEQNAVKALKSELCECKQDNERLLKSLNDVQKEVLQLRSVLDSKENDLKAALQELESERGKELALQSQLEQEQLQHLQREGQNSKALEELRISLEKQYAQNSRLSVALKHEQTVKDNLQKELQIESSRCEALLAQERSRLSKLHRNLEAAQGRSLELSEALQHERVLTEQLSRRAQEACTHQETQAHRALLRKLKDETTRVAELQAALEKVQQHAVCAQQQLEAEVQRRCAELEREKERELELQRQRHEHKIKQLQRKMRELEAREVARLSPESEHLREQQQGLDTIRQQLLCAAGLLTSFINQTVDRTINDWTSSNEKAVTSLLRTLEELKSQLSTSSSPQKKMTAEVQVQLVDVLLKENDTLTNALSTMNQEKAELCRAMSRLEKTLKHHLLKGCALSRSDRRRDRTVLQSSPGVPDPGLPLSASREEANTRNVKMEKLYLHYLRAESFRKALIYQKKYLLLLIGGFQDSEQETLSMIAHLGVFPSKADKKITTSRPFTRFRTAVRVVIAISRLRFLVKKWQEVDRKGALVQGRVLRPGFPVIRQQLAPPETSESPPETSESRPETSESPPTRDESFSHTRDPVPKASPRRRERSNPSPSSRSERSLTASQDPEHSLTEYIHHLEIIQQRLGGLPPDSTSKKSCRQKTKQ